MWVMMELISLIRIKVLRNDLLFDVEVDFFFLLIAKFIHSSYFYIIWSFIKSFDQASV